MYEHVRAVFLDAGLTLVYSPISLSDLCYDVGREHGLHTSTTALEEAIPRATALLHQAQRSDPDVWSSDDRLRRLWAGYYTAVFREAGVDAEAATLEACSAEIYSRYLVPGAWKLYPDVLPTLVNLHERGYKLGVISDWESVLIGKVLLPLGVGRYIDFMVVSGVQREAKPGSGLYREALARAGVEAHQAVHVGDNYITDVLGARSAGIAGILLDREGVRRDMALDCPRIESLEELVALVDR
ncbi:MAG: putative hydrolase of the superfamily [Chloroflexia bacterium]|jgi:HAD superfamily hydrolase (TIGR01549 family)|nr:putative hydrolase of the superfamily [Chloroflexia bacterium]